MSLLKALERKLVGRILEIKYSN